jgi:two-component system chemotaxis response regulator CheY
VAQGNADISAKGADMKHCLVVDDSSVVRKVARRILEDLEFSVVEAEDGRKAIEACHTSMPDLILLDGQMPEMDGVAFLSALREETKGGPTPKVVFCATENDVGHIARAMRAGADDYLMKPFDRDLVEAKLQEVGIL